MVSVCMFRQGCVPSSFSWLTDLVLFTFILAILILYCFHRLLLYMEYISGCCVLGKHALVCTPLKQYHTSLRGNMNVACYKRFYLLQQAGFANG